MINGTDVLLNEYVNDLSEKKIFDEMLNISRSYADVRFSRRLSGAGGVRFNQCDSAVDGFTMYYIQGKMDARNNIMFNTASQPVSIGPLCFRTCPVRVEARTTWTSTKPSTMLFNYDASGSVIKGKNTLLKSIVKSEDSPAANNITGMFCSTKIESLFHFISIL